MPADRETRHQHLHFAASPFDCSAARAVNGQAVILRLEPHGSYEVLLQRRSESMPVMPGHLAAIGGRRDHTDTDSRFTAMREVEEETGLLFQSLRWEVEPVKFAEGAKVDWYVMLVQSPLFAERANSRWEVADARHVLPLLPASATLAECFGHLWLPVWDLAHIDELQQPLMGGLVNRVWEAVTHLQWVLSELGGGCAEVCDAGAVGTGGSDTIWISAETGSGDASVGCRGVGREQHEQSLVPQAPRCTDPHAGATGGDVIWISDESSSGSIGIEASEPPQNLHP